jgi:hypothetical protein
MRLALSLMGFLYLLTNIRFEVLSQHFLTLKLCCWKQKIRLTVLKPTRVGWYTIPRRELMMLKELGKLAL